VKTLPFADQSEGALTILRSFEIGSKVIRLAGGFFFMARSTLLLRQIGTADVSDGTERDNLAQMDCTKKVGTVFALTESDNICHERRA
jgi:hypothetical protein